LQTDKTNAGDTAEKTLENALWALKQEIKHHTPNVSSFASEANRVSATGKLDGIPVALQHHLNADQ